MHQTKPFNVDNTGSAAVEFAILAPIFLILIAAIANIGLAINWRIAAETRISALSNQAIKEDLDFTDEQAALQFLDRIKISYHSGSVAQIG